MKQLSINYAKVLYDLNIEEPVIEETKTLINSTPFLLKELTNPVNQKANKYAVIEKVFPKEIHNFLKVLCNYDSMSFIGEIFEAYETYRVEQDNMWKATIYYVTKPDEKQLAAMKAFLIKEYKIQDVTFDLEQDKDLIGGFVLRVGEFEYDYSLRGRLNKLKQQLNWR